MYDVNTLNTSLAFEKLERSSVSKTWLRIQVAE